MRIPSLHISIYLAIFLHLCFTSPTSTIPLESSSPAGACSGERAEDQNVDSSHQRSCQNLEGLIGEAGLQPEGDLASQFGLGQPVSSVLRMANVEESHVSFSSTKPLPKFAIDYGHDVVGHDVEERQIALTFDHGGGARWRTNVQFESGTFSAKIQTPEGDTSGLNTSFYLSSLEGDKTQDEIDFEFLGKDKGIVQTNYYTLGIGNREEIHQLGFNSSAEFHEYTIRWLPSKIEWLIDGKLVRTAKKENGEAWPVKPMYLYASIWNAGYINDGGWAGPYSGAQEPYVSRYRDVHVPVKHL